MENQPKNMVGMTIYKYLNKMHRLKLLWLILFLPIFNLCTNYSVNKTKTVPPILVSITSIQGLTSSYEIKMRVINQEPFFAGYRLYIADNENTARNPSDLNSGIGCSSGPSIIPNLATEYVVDIGPNSTGLTGQAGTQLCTYEATLLPGQYIAMRTLLLSIQPSNQGGNRINPSLPSNTLIVP